MTKNLNLLFICSRNQWRSPTAEKIWKKKQNFKARSAGTSPNAKRTVGPTDIRWADIIFTMEKKHKNRIVAKFSRLLSHKQIHVLEIPDEYRFMDPELITEIEIKVSEGLAKVAPTSKAFCRTHRVDSP